MIALTQGQREKLIAHNSEKLKGLKDAVKQTAFESVREELEFEIQSTEVALSALTATPEHHIFKHPLGKLFYSLVDESCKGHDDVYPVYAAPPVPEIKLPELMDYADPHTQYCEAIVDGYNRCLAEIKHLNGLGE